MEFQERIKALFNVILTRKGIIILSSIIMGLMLVLFSTLYILKGSMGLLYANLESGQAASIASKLEVMNVPYSLSPDGTAIFVPSNQVMKLRLKVAEDGLISSGSVGYEIFDKSEVANATSFVQHVQMLRALEGELARTIKSIKGVEQVRVHIVLPKRDLFSQEPNEARAAVMVKLNVGTRLSSSTVQAIQNLVSASVQNLKAQAVSVMDDRGTLLARGDQDGLSALNNFDEIKRNYETRTARVIESLLERFVGFGKVRAEVSVDLDLDKITQQSETFDADNPVIRSSQSAKMNEKSAENSSEQASTIQNNIPNAGVGGAGGESSSTAQNKQEETVNYEISKTIQTRVKEGGQIKRLSVAVLVDGYYEKNKLGNIVYKPRNDAELQKIERLVKGAIGAQENRDSIEVLNMRFVNDEIGAGHESNFLGLQSADIHDLLRLVIVAIVSIIGLAILIGALRKGRKEVSEAIAVGIAENNAHAKMNSVGGISTSLAVGEHHGSEEEEIVDLPIGKAMYVKRLEKLIEKETDKAIATIRFWLKQGG